jgi:hypothetical protein
MCRRGTRKAGARWAVAGARDDADSQSHRPVCAMLTVRRAKNMTQTEVLVNSGVRTAIGDYGGGLKDSHLLKWAPLLSARRSSEPDQGGRR